MTATLQLQPWRYPQRPRVLVEHADPAVGLALAISIRQSGCSIAVCRGPGATHPPARCPLHELEACVVVEGADVVVTALGTDGDGPAVLDGLRTRYPSTPLVVVPPDADAGQVVEAVHQALSG